MILAHTSASKPRNDQAMERKDDRAKKLKTRLENKHEAAKI